MKGWMWSVGKALEGIGLILVLLGLVLSVQVGMQDESLKSQRYELYGLGAGVGVFLLGLVLERVAGSRGG